MGGIHEILWKLLLFVSSPLNQTEKIVHDSSIMANKLYTSKRNKWIQGLFPASHYCPTKLN